MSESIYTAENAPSWDEIRAMFARSREEDDRRKAENDKMLRELGRKIAGLGDKFGYFTEGLALPTMEKILKRKFGINNTSPRMKVEYGARNLEFDVFGYRQGRPGVDTGLVVVVEVKSRVKYDSIKQLTNQLEAVRELMPEHAEKDLLGILAGVHWDAGVEKQAREAGFHTARIRNDVFTLTSPKDFEAKHW